MVLNQLKGATIKKINGRIGILILQKILNSMARPNLETALEGKIRNMIKKELKL